MKKRLMETTLNPGKDRVRETTSESINRKIDNDIRENILHYSMEGTSAIKNRIAELDREWDMERLLELNASLLAFGGIVLAAAVNKKWLILPAIITGFLMQHAIQGWCPPLPLFRKMGVRTQKEIETERHALLELLER
jgi:hypothetical protein